jgi:spore coat protein H
MSHNYYMYSNPADNNRLSWIPWDHNESFTSAARTPLPLDFSTTGTDWPLINFMMADSIYNASYKAHLKDFLENTLSDAALKAKFQTAHDLIAPYVIGAEGELAGHTALENPSAFTSSVSSIQAHIDERVNAVSEFLK